LFKSLNSVLLINLQYIHTTHSLAEASHIFLRENYLAMSNTADVTEGKPIAVGSQSISGANAINALVPFYDIHGRKREVLFFYFVPNTTRFCIYVIISIITYYNGHVLSLKEYQKHPR
jgi:hypothetical protein